VNPFHLCACLIVAAITGIAAAQTRTVWHGVYTEEQAKRGKLLYDGKCSSCHMESLAGAESVPPLVGVGFNANWDGLPLSDLYERVRTTMPPQQAGSLSRQEYADVLAYIFSVARFPAGSAPLAGDRDPLAQILFRSNRN